MSKLNYIALSARAATFVALIFAVAAISLAQGRTLPEEDWYGEVKKALAVHYQGKPVKVKLIIPGTRRGLEMLDGAIQNPANANPPEPLAQPGDELIIKNFRVTDNEIEIMLGKEEPAPGQKKRFSNPFSMPKQPRIGLRFSRELTSKDLTIEKINGMLASAVDVTALASPVAEKAAAQASVASPQTETPVKSDEEQGLPKPEIIGNLPALTPSVGELTVESTVKQARVYIDGAYSGTAPRTIRLRKGVHTIMIVSDGYAPWEQKLFIPGAKASVVRAELLQARN